jgi:hypothetical protein
LNTKIHMTVSSETCAVGFILSGDAPEGRLLLDTIGSIRAPCGDPVFLLMNRACEDWAARGGVPVGVYAGGSSKKEPETSVGV